MKFITLLIYISILFLSACSGPDRLWVDYLERLERTLFVQIPTPNAYPLPNYPEKRRLLAPIKDTRIRVSEAWQLNHCALFALLGERNSILGKLNEPESKWQYEHQLLKLLPNCIRHDQTSADNKALLEDILLDKKQNYWKVVWNATFANDDFFALFQLSEAPLSTRQRIDLSAFTDRIEALNDWPEIDTSDSASNVLKVTELTSAFSLAGSVLKSERLALIRLEQANEMLELADLEQTLCPLNKPSAELSIARNILTNVFIADIQPWLVEVGHARRASFIQTEHLLNTFNTVLPKAIAEQLNLYFKQSTELNLKYSETLKTHTTLWQQLFEQCGQKVTPRSL